MSRAPALLTLAFSVAILCSSLNDPITLATHNRSEPLSDFAAKLLGRSARRLYE